MVGSVWVLLQGDPGLRVRGQVTHKKVLPGEMGDRPEKPPGEGTEAKGQCAEGGRGLAWVTAVAGSGQPSVPAAGEHTSRVPSGPPGRGWRNGPCPRAGLTLFLLWPRPVVPRQLQGRLHVAVAGAPSTPRSQSATKCAVLTKFLTYGWLRSLHTTGDFVFPARSSLHESRPWCMCGSPCASCPASAPWGPGAAGPGLACGKEDAGPGSSCHPATGEVLGRF